MTIRHIIWDWNGTLLDDTQARVNAVNGMLAARNLPLIDIPYYRDVFGFPVREFYRTIGFQLEKEDWDEMARDFHDRFLSDTTKRLHHDAIPILTLLKRQGYGQSILSASEQTILCSMLANYGIAAFFDHIRGVDNLDGHSKLELGHALVQRLHLPRESLLLIGDSIHDYEVAEALGIRCLLLPQGHQSAARLAATGSPMLPNLTALAAWLTQP